MSALYGLETEGGAAAPRPDRMRLVTTDGAWRGEWHRTSTDASMRRFAASVRAHANELGCARHDLTRAELAELAANIERGDYVDRF